MFLWNIAVTSLAEVWIEISLLVTISRKVLVTSLAEVWIEILSLLNLLLTASVTSLAEVWIEISRIALYSFALLSLPLRKCGLKF